MRRSEVEPIIVEFIGLPGTGKTTLASIVFNKCFQNDEATHYNHAYNNGALIRLTTKLYSFVKELLFHPKTFLMIYRIVLSSRQRTILDFIKVFFNMIFVTSVSRKANKVNVILDQGIFQSIWSVYSTSKTNYVNEEYLIRFLSVVPLPHIVVFIETDSIELRERLDQRNYQGRQQKKGLLSNHYNIQHQNSLYNNVFRLIEAYGIHLVKINNTDDTDEEEHCFVMKVLRDQFNIGAGGWRGK